ncbi:MAG: hypothetical protein ACREUC_21140, partial [Steroidobacteraceae bacterium]
MQSSAYRADEIAREVLTLAGSGRLYIVLPASARVLWRLKRWWPRFFLDRVLTLRERTRAEATARPPSA